MIQRFMTLGVTTMTNGAGFESARPFLKLSNNRQANGTTPLVKGGASIPPESALGACMIHRGVGTRCPPRVLETLASLPGSLQSCRPCSMERASGLGAILGLGLSEQVQREPALDLALGAHPVDTRLHLAIPPVPTLYRIGRRR